MPIIPIPLTRGMHEEADAKLLPQGLLVTAQNVRYRKDGRLGLRFGYDFSAATGASPSTTVAALTVAGKHDIFISGRTATTSGAPAPFRYAEGNATQPALPGGFVGPFAVLPVGSLGVFERMSVTAGEAASTDGIASCDAVVNGTSIYTVEAAYNLTTKAQTSIAGISAMIVRRLDSSTGAIVDSNTITGAASIGNVKILVLNGTLCVFWANTASNVVRLSTFALTNLATTSTVNVVTASAGRASYFDVAPGIDANTAWLIYHSAANTLSFGDVTSAGAFTLKNTVTTANAEGRPTICATGLAPTNQCAIVWNDGATITSGNCRYTVYQRSSNTFVVATTTFDSSGLCTGYPVVGPHATLDWVAAYNIARNAFTSEYGMGFFRASGSGANAGAGSGSYAKQLVSKPFSNGLFVGVICTDVDDATQAPGGYYVQDIGYATFYFTQQEAHFCQFEAKPADAGVILCDPRRQVVVVPAVGNEPGLTAAAAFLPVLRGAANGTILYRTECGSYMDQLLGADLNGETLLSGARVTAYDGQSVCDSGFPTPIIVALQSTGGAFAAGTYLVVTVWEWFDALGHRHRSAPSLPTSIALGAASAIVVRSQPLHSTPRVPTSIQSVLVTLRVYRTQVGGTTFYDALGYGAFSSVSSAIFGVTLTDTDATIATREILYTQGARGGLSGVLENNRPPAARYICAGSDRVLLGGLENTTEVHWSKLRFEGEPMEWTDFAAHKAQVDGRVTAVGELDGTWFIFTREAPWTVAGDGPDDNGAGSFSAPQRLPSSVGCISHKSVVKFAGGLIYQSARGFELLARGGAAPDGKFGESVRDTVALFPYCSASAFNQVEQLCYWAMTDTAGATGCLIVYDTRIGEWYVDTFYSRAIKALSIYDGKLVIDGGIIETAAYTDDDTGAKTTAIVPSIVMGDLRAFGQTGWGQYVKVQLLGEARDVTVAWSATMDVSYDSGKTFGETATWTRANLATAIGDAIDGAEHYFVTQRTDSVRLRFGLTLPSPNEGIVWNGIQLEVIPADGSKRQAPALRAP